MTAGTMGARLREARNAVENDPFFSYRSDGSARLISDLLTDAERMAAALKEWHAARQALADYPASPSIGGGETWGKKRFVLTEHLWAATSALSALAAELAEEEP